MIVKIKKFGASWCGPCVIIEKHLDNIAEKFPDIEIIKYDADEDEEEFDKMNIKNIPQLFFYNQDNIQVHHLTGAHSLDKIIEVINMHK